MSLTLTQLQTELQARGFDYLSTTRMNYALNTSMRRICEADDWIWLQATTTGSAPLTISDLRTVMSVVDTTNQNTLVGLDRRTVLDTVDPTLTTTGTPTYYYRSSDTQLSVYPANTSVTLSVAYIKVPTDLSAGSDTPVIPSRYHYAIVDGAVIDCLKDSDNLDEASTLEAQFQTTIEEMRGTYIYDHFTQDFQRVVGQDY